MNPVIPKAFLEKEKARDIDNYTREFLAEFSEKLESFFTFEMIQKPFTLAGDIPYRNGSTYYLGFDQSGLSGKDRFALSIGHSEGEKIYIDVVRSWQTKDLETILNDIEILKNQYHINTALVDRFAVGYIRSSFKRIGLEIELRPLLPEVYVNLKSLILQDTLSLPDRPDLRAGMRNTLAIYNKSNQLSIYHERGPEGHSDSLDAVCACAYGVTLSIGDTGPRIRFIGGNDSNDKMTASERLNEARQAWLNDDDDNNSGGLLTERYSQIGR